MSKYINISPVVQTAILINSENRKRNADDKEYLSSTDWVKDFCTIHIDIGRATGKTYFIETNADTGDVIIVKNNLLKYEMLDYFKEIDKKIFVLVASEIESHREIESPYTIFIDEPSACFQDKSYDDILKILIDPQKDQTVIMLGA